MLLDREVIFYVNKPKIMTLSGSGELISPNDSY